MDKIVVDFGSVLGKIKPMHAVNNGPIHKFHTNDQTASNLNLFADAGIPFARTHDASHCAGYGGSHIVDVNNIFTDWDADPYDPNSYDFICTDNYLRCIDTAGTKIFYRLGSSIEHWVKKYNTIPPKDFKKWAIVCEQIIRHYTEGWANGYHYEGTYWEIWNEPDLDADDSLNKRCWGGTAKQFIEFYNVAFNHLKKCFPTLKIGGPAIANNHNKVKGSGDPSIEGRSWVEVFFENIEQKPDFFSWHVYASTVEKMRDRIRISRQLMNKYGMGNEVESILNEWNYVRGWQNEDWYHSKIAWKNLKGSAFVASVMEMSQYEDVDMLMYYDARPGAMNCLFDTDMVHVTKKGYYPFWIFNKLYKQGNAVRVERETEKFWAVGAKGEEEQSVMLTYFDDADDAEREKEIKIEFNNVENENGVKLEYYALDENRNVQVVREEKFMSNNFASFITMPLYSTYYLKITKL